jgi:Rieske Fe-S protein
MSSQASRRDVLRAAAWGAMAAGGVFAARLVAAAIGRRPRPRRRLLAVGPLAALAEGGRLSAPGVILLRDERGVAAISSRCTHLGCTVTANARGFECNCHGSAFARDGRVVRGPATTPLAWYLVVLGDDGELRVDLDRTVSPSTRLAVPGPRVQPVRETTS